MDDFLQAQVVHEVVFDAGGRAIGAAVVETGSQAPAAEVLKACLEAFELLGRVVATHQPCRWERHFESVSYEFFSYPAGPARATTAYRRLGEREREAAAISEAVMAAAPIGILIYRASGECLWVNDAASKVTGGTRSELLAQNFRRLPSWQRGGLLEAALEALESGRHIKRRVHTVTTFKKEVWYDTQLTRFILGGETLLLLMVEDVTARTLAEHDLAASNARFRHLFEALPDAVYIGDSAGRILLANESGCRQLGRCLEQLLGAYGLDLVAPSARASAQRRMANLEGVVGRPFESVHLRADGVEIPVEVSLSRIEFGGGPASLLVVRDVSVRKALEVRIAQSQKMEAVGRLAGGIAHDFNNLLAAILMSISYLELAGANREELGEGFRAIKEQINRGAKLARQLLDFARGGISRFATFDVNAVVERLTTLFARGHQGLAVVWRPASGTLSVHGDETQVEQVVLNLLLNAGEAMAHRGDLQVSTEQVELTQAEAEVHTVRRGVYVRINVRDTGVGIRSDDLGRIFEPFYTTKPIGKGSGLGLASVYGITKNHEGFVQVESSPGRGSLFSVFLPASGSPATTAIPEAATSGASGPLA